MPRRKQLAPKRLKGNIEKSSEGDWKEGENVQDEEDGEDVEASKEEEDKPSDGPIELSTSPSASWSFKFTPFGSNTERVMGTSTTPSGSGISKVFSKGIWYPDDLKCSTENNNPHVESSHSEGENDKLKRKASARSESHSSNSPEKEKKCERRTTRVSSGQRDHENDDKVQRHSSSSLIRENLRHYFLDKLKSSGKVVKDEDVQKNQRQIQREGIVGRTSPERSSSHGTRSNYTHTVLWMPPKVSDKSPNEPVESGLDTFSKASNDCSKGTRNSFLESSKFQDRLNLAKEIPTSSTSHHQGREGHREGVSSRSSPSHSSTSDCTKKSPSRVHEENGDSSVSDTSSPSDYYHSYHSAGMAYYQSPFMGYGLYPSYPNFVYPYNYGYVVAVPGGLFIPMGNSYSQSSGLGPSSSLGPHKDAPLDLSACSTTKKEEDVKPDMVKKEEPPPSSSSSSSVKQQTKRAGGSSKKAKGEKTMVLWKKVPRHAMMMDMAQLSVLEKVHVLYTTESVFLCFICSDCHALFNSLDLLVLHAVGTAHTSRNDLDDRAMELKGFDVIPVDKITKKQKNSEKKPEFSFESPLQSTVSLHRRRLPAGKDFLLKSRDVYKCSVCPETFPNFLRYTMHMNETGHRRKSVRYSDVYKAQRQVKKILKCMNCEKSFMTLEELTMHMIKTKHYSDIAGGFANQADLEEDAEYDHLDHVHENHLDGVEHQSTVHPRLPPSHKSHDSNIADGTSSESENPASPHGSPRERCRSHSPGGRSRESDVLMSGTDQKVKETWMDSEQMDTRGMDGQKSAEQMSTEVEGQNNVTASTSQPYSSPSLGTKRDMRELDEEQIDSPPKKVKMESASLAGDEDEYQTLAGYETENEFEDEDEEEFMNEDYDIGSFSDSHAKGSDQENCFLPSDLSRKKLRRRIYKHSLLYQCRKNRTEGTKEVSAFDGLYNWAKSLGLLSSASATQPTTVAQMPKAVVKCDGKYVDPDNFDVTLPYGGKVRPDINPLSKLSSMVETTQIKQSNAKSFESNFIMDRAYFNFEKNHGNPSQGTVPINPSHQSDSEGGNDSRTNSRTCLNSPTEEQCHSEPSPKTPTQHFTKQMQSLKDIQMFQNSSRQLPSVSSQLQGWAVNGTLSKDAVLERLILKAYNRPSRSDFTLPSSSKEHCTCSVKPEIKTSTGDLETRSSETEPDGQYDTENDARRVEDPEKHERLLGGDRNVCYKCSGKNRTLKCNVGKQLPSDSGTAGTVRQDEGLPEAAHINQRVKGMGDNVDKEEDGLDKGAKGPDDEQERKSDERSVEAYGNLFFGRDRHSSKSPGQRNVDRGCLQDLIYGPRDSPGVREVKFTWAEAIDTLISRIFEPEVDPIEQPVSDSLHRDTPRESEKNAVSRGSEVREGQTVCDDDDCQGKEADVGPENMDCKGKFDDDQSKDQCHDVENELIDKGEEKRGKHSHENDGDDDDDDDDGDDGDDDDKDEINEKMSEDINSNKESICKTVNGDTAKVDHDNGLKDENGQKEKASDEEVSDLAEATETDWQPDKKYCPDKMDDETVSGFEKNSESCDDFKKESAECSDEENVDSPVERGDTPSDEAVRSSPKIDFSERKSSSPLERCNDARSMASHYNAMSSMSRYSGHGFKYSMAKRFFDFSLSPSHVSNDSSKRSENFSNDREEVEETPSEAGSSVERCSSEAPRGSDSICSRSMHLKPHGFHKENHHLPGYFHYSGPPPLIPNADASTKAIQRLEELTRKPSVTNVKEMILNKIQEEVERLTAPDYESSQVSFHLPPRPSYLHPLVGNNNNGDASGKSLKSLEELSKCSPLSPFQRLPSDSRLMGNKDGLTFRHDVGLKYLPPSATPESNVSVIQSLEKLSNEHPVLRRKEQPVSQPPSSPVVWESPLSVPEKLQYLPPSFGMETSDGNSIQSLERFSSQHPFFSIPGGQPHSSLSSSSGFPRRIKEELSDDGCLPGIQNQFNKTNYDATPVDFSVKPKEHPLQPIAIKMTGSSIGSEERVIIKVEPEDEEKEPFESTLSKTKENRERVDDDSDCDEGEAHLTSNRPDDPLSALDNLVRMKQSTEVSPSPSKVALDLVSKDMKSPLYVLPPDEVGSQSEKNPLEEMNKMVKLT